MKHPIGFTARFEPKEEIPNVPKQGQSSAPVKSVVQVRLPGCNIPLAYYNDRFDLKPGDLVFVDGKYAGVRGRVEKVSTHFKIKVDDYKRVLGVVDPVVRGKLYQAGSHFVIFDRQVLPYEQFRGWMMAPVPEDEEYYIGYDDDSFELSDLAGMHVSQEIYDRGGSYYHDCKVLYIELDGEQGRAIVDGTHPYEVEFQYKNGRISNLICSCPYGATCKHEVAAMMQLRESLDIIEKYYPERNPDDYFAVVFKPIFFQFAIDCDDVCLTLS